MNWRWMFFIFGIMGFIWIFAWILSYKELRIISNDDDYIIAPSMLSGSKKWIDYFKYSQLWSIYLAHFAMSWTTNIITVWLPYYLSKNLGVKATTLSLTAVPYIINSLFSIGIHYFTRFPFFYFTRTCSCFINLSGWTFSRFFNKWKMGCTPRETINDNDWSHRSSNIHVSVHDC